MFNFVFFFEFIFLFNLFIFIIFVLIKYIFFKYDLYVNKLFSNNEFVFKNFLYFLSFLLFWYFFISICLINEEFFFFFFSFYSNELIICLKILITIFFFLTILVSSNYLKNNNLNSVSFEFIIIIIFSVLGSLVLVASNDFLTIFLGLELQSLSFYVLAAYKQSSIFSIEAGLKYFILGSFSSGILVFGISLLYGFLGIYNLSDLKYFFLFERFNNLVNVFVFLGLLFVFVALLFKFSAAPFHIWVPDVYEGAPTLITFFFSVVPKFSYFGIFIRFFCEILNIFIDYYIKFLFLGVCMASLILGSVAALIQKKIKRLLAYSSITNIGFILIGFSTVNIEGFSASLIYFVIYNFILVSLFYIVLTVTYLHNGLFIKNINEFFSLLNENFVYCSFFLISLFSLVGLPPMAGFVGKLYLFIIALISNFEILFLVAAYASLISAVVYLRILRNIFFNKHLSFFSLFITNNNSIFLLNFFFLFNLCLFFFPMYFFYYFYNLIFTIFL